MQLISADTLQLDIDSNSPTLLLWWGLYHSTTLESGNCSISLTKTQNQPKKSECNHDLMSVAHKVPDHQLHDEQHLQAAMTPHWLDQFNMVCVAKYKVICTRFWAKCYKSISVLSLYCIFISNRKTLPIKSLVTIKRHVWTRESISILI
jgi:hypothetical protein